jgi:hypothetical protein
MTLRILQSAAVEQSGSIPSSQTKAQELFRMAQIKYPLLSRAQYFNFYNAPNLIAHS